jgi:hypothetical protein
MGARCDLSCCFLALAAAGVLIALTACGSGEVVLAPRGGEVDASIGADAASDGGQRDGDAASAEPGTDAAGEGGTGDAGGGATDAAGVDAACSPVAQTGCGAGAKCTIDPPTCVPNGTVMTGGACGPQDNCVAGNLCTYDGTHEICREFCAGDSDCKQAAVPSGTTPEPGNVAHCAVTITGTSWKVCSVACNPVAAAGPSGCASGMGCTYYTTTAGEVTNCWTAGTSQEGTACTYTSDCAPGLVCLNNGTSAHCRAVCRNATPSDCLAGDVCVQPGVSMPMFGFCCPKGGC